MRKGGYSLEHRRYRSMLIAEKEKNFQLQQQIQQDTQKVNNEDKTDKE